MKIKPLNDLPLLKEVGELAATLGLEAYVVGGCARDWALGRISGDVDFLVSGSGAVLAEALVKKHGGTLSRFDNFLTVRAFLGNGRRIDFAGFRKETYIQPAALPSVLAAASVTEDLKRRDFSVNALAVSVLAHNFGEVTDPFNGLADLKEGLIKVLHPLSFSDDPTRLFRAVRFAGRFGWRLEDETWELAVKCVKEDTPNLLSRERVRNELFKLLEEKDPSDAFALLRMLHAYKFLHREFIWPAGAAELTGGALPRLTAICAAMGREAFSFLESLRLPNKTIASIKRMALGSYGKNL